MAKDITLIIEGPQGVGKTRLHYFLKPMLRSFTNLIGITIQVIERQPRTGMTELSLADLHWCLRDVEALHAKFLSQFPDLEPRRTTQIIALLKKVIKREEARKSTGACISTKK